MTRARDVANLIGSGNYSSTTFTATAGQTAFTISHTQGFVQVFMNGLLLDETVDYTSNGSAVTLTSGAAAGDEIEVVAYNTFSVGDALNQAAADTRYVNTSGDTMTGNLGIGAAPTSALSIEGSGFTDSTIRLKRTAGGTNNDAGLQFTSAAGANSGYGMGGIWFKNSVDNNAYALIRARTDDSTGTSGRLDFITSDAAVGNSTASRMTIDSLGRVTMSNQPCFLVTGNSGGWQTVSAGGTSTVSFNGEQFDQGNCFNNSTMRFVAPVAGKYLLHFSAYVRLETNDDDTNHAYTRIMKNGNYYAETFHVYGYINNGDADQQAGITVIMDMSANDYAMCALSAASGSASFYQSGCQFMGYLVA